MTEERIHQLIRDYSTLLEIKKNSSFKYVITLNIYKKSFIIYIL